MWRRKTHEILKWTRRKFSVEVRGEFLGAKGKIKVEVDTERPAQPASPVDGETPVVLPPVALPPGPIPPALPPAANE